MSEKLGFPNINPAKVGWSLFDEFKAFAFKGNVIDLAVGVIIGAAFGGIVTSLVKNIIMPSIALMTPGKDLGYEKWAFAYDGKEVPYGLFLADVLNFLIVAFALFIFIQKFLGWLMKSRKEEAPVVVPPTKDQLLLEEIRDLLKANATR